MIVFDLECKEGGHRFEGWFASSDDFSDQQSRGMLCCPQCGSDNVGKAPMAPAVPRKSNQQRPAMVEVSPPVASRIEKAMVKLAAMQADALKSSTWVGADFAEQSRAMHYGEREVETIHGQASLAEAKTLLEEGIAVMPLPFPVAPPDELN